MVMNKYTPMAHPVSSAAEGELDFKKQFRHFNYPVQEFGVVPPLLIYADLVAVADPRTIEAAEMLYDNYLIQYFG
jgi:hypothetical protein